MARTNKGLLGGLSGRISNLVAGSWKGISYFRSRPSGFHDPKTKAQIQQRTRFKLVLDFIRPVKEFIKLSFRQYAINMTEYNKAMSWNMKNAIAGAPPDLHLDYSAVLLSHGDLTPPQNAHYTLTSPTVVSVQWDDNSDQGSAKPTDYALLVAYNEDKQHSVWIANGPKRKDKAALLQLPSDYKGDTIHVYFAFARHDYSISSDSIYLGDLPSFKE
ncbi:MAG: DUF6266 family protein [Bacteroidales bacterium]|nr:DUF6266 family protein [Bacteroidales bacterium]MCF8326927.1 DUF6266 family protein [Bacteroidales bacterium]